MKVLHVTQGYYPAIGGTEHLIQRVSEELVAQHGDQVTIFTTNCYNGDAFHNPRLPRLPVGEEQVNGVIVRRFPVRSRISQLLWLPQAVAYRLKLPGNDWLRTIYGGPIIAGLFDEIRSFEADVIVASSFPLLHMYDALRGAKESGRPCVLHGGLHPEDPWGFGRPMIYRAIRQATRYIANTEYEAQYLVDRGLNEGRICTIGAGVDIEIYNSVTMEEAKDRLGVKGDPVVGFIGQLVEHKGVDTLVRAMPLVWETFPDVHFLIAGARSRFFPEMEALIDAVIGQEDERLILRFDFPQEEKPWLYAALDVFAYPSSFESFGIAFLEAWAGGKPVIGARRGAVPWVVQDGKDGILVEDRNEMELAEAVLRLLEDPVLAQGLGRVGQQKVVEQRTWPRIADRFREAYQDAIREHSWIDPR